MTKPLVLAPIKGYTDPLWRSCYFDHFSGLDKVVTPFLILSEHTKAKKSYFPRFFPELGTDVEVVPQLLVKKAETVLYAAEIMDELGIKEYNLNMGCPAPAIYKKGRGSGLMQDLSVITRLLDGVLPSLQGDFTVKIRTGIENSSLLQPLIEILNKYKLKEVIVHPRYAKQLYRGTPDMEAFDYVYHNSVNPVSYNGDINTLEDYNGLLERYPDLSSVMIGRGVLMDPFLPEIIKSGKKPGREERVERTLKYMRDFEFRVKENYYKESIANSRVKSIMIYLASWYSSDEEIITRIKRAKDLDQMLKIIDLN